jgi:hypothetical protein
VCLALHDMLWVKVRVRDVRDQCGAVHLHASNHALCPCLILWQVVWVVLPPKACSALTAAFINDHGMPLWRGHVPMPGGQATGVVAR